MIQTLHKATGGRLRHVCSFGRPAAATFDWTLYKLDGSTVASAAGVVGTMADTTVATAASRGDRVLHLVGALDATNRNLMVQPQALGNMESLRSFSLPCQVGAAVTDAVLFDPLPIDLAVGDRVQVNEVAVLIGAGVTSGLDAGVYLFEVSASDEAGDLRKEVERVAITSSNLAQPATYSGLVRRYPALLDQGRPEDPDFAVALDTALGLTVEQLERWGVDWWAIRSWDQLEPAIAARCAANEFLAMGQNFEGQATKAEAEAVAFLRDTVDRLVWIDTDAGGTPSGDKKPNVARVWVGR